MKRLKRWKGSVLLPGAFMCARRRINLLLLKGEKGNYNLVFLGTFRGRYLPRWPAGLQSPPPPIALHSFAALDKHDTRGVA